MEASTCPSCGWESVGSWSTVEPPLRASPECYASYQELSAYNLLRARSDFLHQEAVDAYAAQHPGPPAKPITIWFALVGLHLSLDQGRPGRQVQHAHMKLARRRRTWPMLQPPDDLRCTSAGDVMRHPAGDVRDDAVLSWAAEVWQGWASVQPTIAALCADEGL